MTKFKQRRDVLNTQELPKLTVRSMVVDKDTIIVTVDLKSYNQNVIEAQTSSLKSRLKFFIIFFKEQTNKKSGITV